MVIDKVHGLQSTNITLNERFTMLAAVAPVPAPMRKKRRPSNQSLTQTTNYRNRNLIEEIARQLQLESNKQALHQRIGRGPGRLRRFGSEGNLPALRRANSFGNLTQAPSVKSRLTWRQSNGNLNNRSRSVSVSGSVRGGRLRGFRRRSGPQRALRGRFRGGRQGGGRVTRVTRNKTQRNNRGRQQGNRGGILRKQTPKPVPTKEELDAQLDQYMSGTKAALDKELDNYMREAMELDGVL